MINNVFVVTTGAWIVGFSLYVAGRKLLGYKTPNRFTTTDFKRQFKKHKMNFNNEFKSKQ